MAKRKLPSPKSYYTTYKKRSKITKRSTKKLAHDIFDLNHHHGKGIKL